MSGQIEELLQQSLARRADSVTTGPAFSAADVVSAGRTARVRQRLAVAGVAALVAVAVIATTLTVRGPATGLPPGPGPAATDSASITPDPTSTDAPEVVAPSISPGSLGLGIVSADAITAADGTVVVLSLPNGLAATQAARVPGGWVVDASSDAGSTVWFRSDGGVLTHLGPNYGGWAVAPDGRTVVLVTDGSEDVAAFNLPAATRRAATSFSPPTGPGEQVVGITGDWVILRETSGDGSPTRIATWNMQTDVVQVSEREAKLWGITDDGRVLRWLPDQAPVDSPPTSACIDLVRPDALTTLTRSGTCLTESADAIAIGWVSPDGTWALVKFPNQPSVVGLAQLPVVAEQWPGAPVGLGESAAPWFWTSADTWIMNVEPGGLVHCRVAHGCTPVEVPTGVTELVRSYGF